jgi:hypothetical protein
VSKQAGPGEVSSFGLRALGMAHPREPERTFAHSLSGRSAALEIEPYACQPEDVAKSRNDLLDTGVCQVLAQGSYLTLELSRFPGYKGTPKN